MYNGNKKEKKRKNAPPQFLPKKRSPWQFLADTCFDDLSFITLLAYFENRHRPRFPCLRPATCNRGTALLLADCASSVSVSFYIANMCYSLFMAAKKKMDAQKTTSTKKSSANKPKPVAPPEPPDWIRDKYAGRSYLGPTGAPVPRSAPSSNAGNSLSAMVARFIYGAGGPKTTGR